LKSNNISQIRLIFLKAPIFLKSTRFFEKRQYFSNPPDFLKSANISQIRLIFRKAQEFCKFCLVPGCKYLYVFSVIISAFLLLSMHQYFIGTIVLTFFWP
jgi:hypothetical protein